MKALMIDVFIHGFLGSNEMWKVLDLSSENSIFIELPGHNTILHSQNIIEKELTFIEGVKVVAEKIPDIPVRLIGYSMGARVALAIALLPHTSIEEIILISVHPGLSDVNEIEKRKEEESELKRLLLEKKDMTEFVSMWENKNIFKTQKRLPEEVFKTQRAMRLFHEPLQIAKAIDTFGLGVMPDFSKKLSLIKIPVKLCVGEVDEKFLKIAVNMNSVLNNSKIKIISKSGHNPIIENPVGFKRECI
jgi:2-succinyl-6-hydroxy-2,4-cyclohexadiene-1-carboxylate synthase